jgi:hypothetical protein
MLISDVTNDVWAVCKKLVIVKKSRVCSIGLFVVVSVLISMNEHITLYYTHRATWYIDIRSKIVL